MRIFISKIAHVKVNDRRSLRDTELQITLKLFFTVRDLTSQTAREWDGFQCILEHDHVATRSDLRTGGSIMLIGGSPRA